MCISIPIIRPCVCTKMIIYKYTLYGFFLRLSEDFLHGNMGIKDIMMYRSPHGENHVEKCWPPRTRYR